MDRLAQLLAMLADNPRDPFLQHALALEHIKRGEEREAERLFRTILQEDPSYVGSYYHLGKLLERTGRNDEAMAWYEKGMEEAKRAGAQRAYNELHSAKEELEE